MPISLSQKQETNLELLRAFIVQYDKAKRLRIPRIVLTYVLALIVPFVILQLPNLKTFFSVLGVSWSVIALICVYVEKDYIKTGAKIQDEFDTKVLNIAWNKILVGSHIASETIHNLNLKFEGTTDMKWYGDLDNIAFPYDVILCQRNNVVWDWRLRLNYFKYNIVTLVLILVAGILFACQLHMFLEDYLKIILLPSSSAFILGFKELTEHFENFQAKKKLEEKLDGLLQSALKKGEIIDGTTLRQVQDVIYILRKCPAVIPTWFANMHKKKYEIRMQSIINKYRNELSYQL